MLRRNAAVALLLPLALIGCGADTENGGGDGPDATTEVRATVARFGVATRTHDWQAICDDLLSQTLVSKIEDVGLPCETAVEKGLGDVKDPTLEITDVSIAGARALVSIHTTARGQEASDDALQLVEQDGEWRIASLATPSEGGASTTTTTVPPATTPATTTTTASAPATTTTTASAPTTATTAKTTTSSTTTKGR